MNICEICKTSEESRTGKYKCPTCYLKYCSVACWNKHKETKCVKVTKEENIQAEKSTSTQYLFPTADTVDPLLLEKLEQSEKLKSLLQNPHLKQIIVELDKAPNVQPLIQEAMLEPIFTEFADACLEVVEPYNLEQRN